MLAGQESALVLTGVEDTGNDLLVKMVGEPRDTWYEDILQSRNLSGRRISFIDGQIDLHVVATDFKTQRGFVFDSIGPYIRDYIVQDIGENDGDDFTMPIWVAPISRKVRL
jgi:hypothetical protein